MDFRQKKKLKELRDKYKYDRGVAFQQGHNFREDIEELEVLAAMELNETCKHALEEYLLIMTDMDLANFTMFGIVVNEVIGRLGGRLDSIFTKEQVDKAFESIDSHREKYRKQEHE